MKRQLLVVDDETPILDSLQRSLGGPRSAWQVTCVDRASAALGLLTEDRFDAVVTDIRMPGMTGLELLAEIRRSQQTRDTPVVVLTGLADHGLKQRALESGASDLLGKPVDAGLLVARLENVLAMKAEHDRLAALVAGLEATIRQKDSGLRQWRWDVLRCLGNVAEYRDGEEP